MCNLYNVRTNQAAIRDIARTMRGSVGNLQMLPGIYPDGTVNLPASRRGG